MSNELKTQDQLEKLARMRSSGMTNVDIAQATGLSESRVSQIFETKEFLAIQEVIGAEQFEQQELVNSGWDSVEALGISKVVETLQANPDPDFALRAAVVANKATRRGNYKNNPIAQRAGVKAVIVLNNTFVERLRSNTTVLGETDKEKSAQSLVEQKKAVNFLSPNEVQDLLTITPTDEQAQMQALKTELPDFIPLAVEECLA